MYSQAVFNKRVTRPAAHVHALQNEGVHVREQSSGPPSGFNLQEYLMKHPPKKDDNPVDTVPENVVT